jgi:hypothetical protein
VNGQGLRALAGGLHALAGPAFGLHALAGGLHALAGVLHAWQLPALLDGDLLSGGRSRRSSHN